MEDKKHILTRRDFIRGTIGATLGYSVLGLKWPAAAEEQDANSKSPARSSVVTIVRDEHVMDASMNVDTAILKTMFEQTLTRTAGKNRPKDAWLSLVKPDDVVGLVTTPALNPTNKDLIEIVKMSLEEAGIPQDHIVMAQSRSTDKVKACSALISMPALKAHWLTGIGTVIKNYITFSGNPRAYHGAGSAKLGEIWNLPDVKGKTKLVLVDALYPLCDKGPQVDPKYKWPYNGLIAGFDPVAVETVCLKIITAKRHAIKGEPWPLSPPPICVEAADKVYGLGTSRMEEIKIVHYGWDKDLLV